MDGLGAENSKEKGFTLVEIAIVMIVIGLLIAGMLKGQEIIANTQITSTVSQIKGIDKATVTFRNMYEVLPGDMLNPDLRLPNCTGTVCSTAGDQDGEVNDRAPNQAPGATHENLLFFTHLSAAGFLPEVSSEPDVTDIDFGEELPETDIGASGYFVGFTTGNPATLIGPAMNSGHYLAIAASPTTNLGTAAGVQALTTSQAARIDRKLDDGMPNSGVVRASGNSACTDNATVTGVYDEAVDQNNCNLFIRIEG